MPRRGLAPPLPIPESTTKSGNKAVSDRRRFTFSGLISAPRKSPSSQPRQLIAGSPRLNTQPRAVLKSSSTATSLTRLSSAQQALLAVTAITWEDSLDDGLSGFIAFVKTAQGTTATISPPADVVSELGVDVAAAVGGRPALVGQGTALDPECEDPPSLPCTAAPRTAVATSADGRTLFLVVVDGWQPGSYGLRSAELAVFLAADLGVRSALQLDSASASTMHVASLGGLVSSPSDGNERPVANHLAIFHGQLDPGSIQGGVFDTVVGGDKLLGATVTLDTGETTTYTGDTLWSFVVPPRYVCATGSADGFQDQTQCRQISSGENEFASMALLPNGVNQPDAGPGSAADGGPGGDGDAGVNPEDSGGCGCLAATVKPSDNPARDLPAVLACWGLLLVVFRSRSG